MYYVYQHFNDTVMQANVTANRILFVGLTNLDVINVCDGYPLEDTDQRAISQRWQRGGNASNNCTIISKLLEWKEKTGFKVEFFGTVTDDGAAKFMIDDFSKRAIITENVVVHANSPSPSSCVIINAHNGSRTIVHYNRDSHELSLDDFKKLDLNIYKHIHFESRNVENIKQMMGYIREKDVQRKITISMELEKGSRDKTHLKELLVCDVDILFVEKDFAAMIGCYCMDDVIQKLSQQLVQKPIIICPWGEMGAKAIDSKSKDMTYSAIFPPKSGVKDTLGAGDTFLASTLFALKVLNYHLDDSVKFGCQVAGAKCALDGFDHLNHFMDYI